MSRCGFIPPFVLENLAKANVEEARISAWDSNQTTAKRSAREINVYSLVQAAAKNPLRYVYDCQNKGQQRVKLVRKEGDPATGDQDVNLVYDFAGVTRDFYKNTLKRNSIDDNGLDLILNVHYGVKYMNAYWDGDEMTFGDGDGKIFTAFDKSLDVVAHELTHGVTQYTANLVYKGQSGALNEHFSDVIGSAIQQYYDKVTAEKADWLIGNEIMGPTLYGEALRSMKAPGTAYDNDLLGKDPQPDHMKDYYNGSSDNYGVHINSGIPNKAFYLVSMDIGTDKAALIWYEALKKLIPTADFNFAVKKIADSARDLTNKKQVPQGSTQSVRAAFKEVGLPTK
ncbi:Thermolysin metallopeptidase, alpha-helical domain [uncultured archaeon]|nr:Thermolysin metallopeptidase, alpha-helical domain [uncultured archaeon]